MKDGEPCTSRGVSTVLEGVTPRPRTKGSMAWRFLPYELYTIQRYLQYRLLQEMGLIHFDDWASNFGETVHAIELSPEGTGYRAKTRFAKFYNLPELMAAFKEVADIQTADMLKLPVPKANFHTEVIQPSELQKEMIQGLAERAEKIRAGGVDPHVDNMLRITNDGRNWRWICGSSILSLPTIPMARWLSALGMCIESGNRPKKNALHSLCSATCPHLPPMALSVFMTT